MPRMPHTFLVLAVLRVVDGSDGVGWETAGLVVNPNENLGEQPEEERDDTAEKERRGIFSRITGSIPGGASEGSRSRQRLS